MGNEKQRAVVEIEEEAFDPVLVVGPVWEQRCHHAAPTRHGEKDGEKSARSVILPARGRKQDVRPRRRDDVTGHAHPE